MKVEFTPVEILHVIRHVGPVFHSKIEWVLGGTKNDLAMDTQLLV